MYKIIAICGKSGTGKSTILKHYKEHQSSDDNYNCIISYTTRPIRENETNSEDYNFVATKEEFDSHSMLEVSKFNGWYYGTAKESLDENKVNIGIFNPEGIKSLLNLPKEEYQVEVIMLVCPAKTRLVRSLERENCPDVDEIIRRYNSDENDFLTNISGSTIMHFANTEDKLDMVLGYIGCLINMMYAGRLN